MHNATRVPATGVQRREERRLRAQVAGIAEQFHQRLAHRAEQELGHRRAVPTPQRVEFVRDRENQVMVCAPEQSRALALQPTLGSQALALRADPLVTGVVERARAVAFGAAAQVPAQRRRAAV